MSSSIVEKFRSMEYGPAPEDASDVYSWLDGHKRTFGHYIGGNFTTPGQHSFTTANPATGEVLEPAFRFADAGNIRAACQLAATAFGPLRQAPPEQRARLLDAIADGIEALGDRLLKRAHRETGLPLARLQGERTRTINQLKLFAGVLREGSWQRARIDRARPDDHPMRPDIRQRQIPLGPVAIFGASNFPLAFSVAGGDTASALAAGCPVVVKAHEAHPGTSELVGQAIMDAVTETDLPVGTFALLFGDGPTVGAELVQAPQIRAVSFTGSRRAGTAIMRAAAERNEPIPVFAEMSSVNPVFLLPGALAGDSHKLATAFIDSLTMGAGQFCTNPGLLVAIDGAGLDSFLHTAAATLKAASPSVMLTAALAHSYEDSIAAVSAEPGITVVARGRHGDGAPAAECRPALLVTTAATFFDSDAAKQEIFGAASLVIRCANEREMLRVADALEGQLTATVHAAEADLRVAASLLPRLEVAVGRIIFNGWPTGVEVGHAMVHGGPFPATSDPRFTSVGSLAIQRFLRPVAYQDVPPALLPSAIADANPDGIWRLTDGAMGRA